MLAIIIIRIEDENGEEIIAKRSYIEHSQITESALDSAYTSMKTTMKKEIGIALNNLKKILVVSEEQHV